MYVQAQGPVDDMQRALQNVNGVVRVNVADHKADTGVFEVDTEKGADVRRELATAIVRGGWGLLELRPVRVSLEEIFLSLTTEETATPEPAEATAGNEGEEVANA
jgi:ABC-2 type transport system ATP-binding protein